MFSIIFYLEKSKMDTKEYRIIIKHLFLSGLSAKQIDENLEKTYGKSKPSYSTVKNWVAKFKTGHMSTLDEPRTGRPNDAISNKEVEKIKQLIFENRNITIRTIAETLGLSYGTTRKAIAKYIGIKVVTDRQQTRADMSL